MHLAKVIGTVVATQKYPTLEGIAFKLIQPCDDKGASKGEIVVACDTMRCREGDMVIWVAKREASIALPGAQLVNFYPIDAAITGLVDQIGSRRV